MTKVYHRVSVYPCLNDIYMQGAQFGRAGKVLIESGEQELLVPGMVNICLALEIFLKSINASMECSEVEKTNPDGSVYYEGQDDSIKISPGGKGHKLSLLFRGLPIPAKKEISRRATSKGLGPDDISVEAMLEKYDDVFVEWRYIYEKTNPQVLGTHPLLDLYNVVLDFCEIHRRDLPKVKAILAPLTR